MIHKPNINSFLEAIYEYKAKWGLSPKQCMISIDKFNAILDEIHDDVFIRSRTMKEIVRRAGRFHLWGVEIFCCTHIDNNDFNF